MHIRNCLTSTDHSERDTPMRDTHCYGWSKLWGEEILILASIDRVQGRVWCCWSDHCLSISWRTDEHNRRGNYPVRPRFWNPRETWEYSDDEHFSETESTDDIRRRRFVYRGRSRSARIVHSRHYTIANRRHRPVESMFVSRTRDHFPSWQLSFERRLQTTCRRWKTEHWRGLVDLLRLSVASTQTRSTLERKTPIRRFHKIGSSLLFSSSPSYRRRRRVNNQQQGDSISSPQCCWGHALWYDIVHFSSLRFARYSNRFQWGTILHSETFILQVKNPNKTFSPGQTGVLLS